VRLRGLLTTLLALGAWAWCCAGASAQLPPLPVGGGDGPTPSPYGTDDAGGFRNVLPPGSNGLDTIADFTRFQSSGERPPHFADQLGLYTDLIYASPALTHDQLGSYFKDATFGVPDGEVESTISPRPGLTIVRDKQYGVPHIYGKTRGDVMFGTGYVGAQDRLFLMDVLRHTGRAELSSFAGGAASNRAMDRVQWQLAPYTEADLQMQIDRAEEVYGERGKQVHDDLVEYVAGINQYISEAQLDPSKKPAEYSLLGIQLEPWKGTDVIATASLIGGIFGKGGGSELRSALTFQAFVDRFGRKKGKRAWLDFRRRNDPESPTTARRKFPYQTGSPFRKRGLAMPDRGSVEEAPPGPPLDEAGAAASRGALGFDPRELLRHRHQSNALLVSAKHSGSGHPVAVMGPQVGYYVPQILMEEDLHGPGIDARGATFPGVNLYVQLGHGRDYAWSATTAGSDNVDTFAEKLCQDDFHYEWRGQCVAMEKLERTNSWTPNALDQTPPGSETLTVYRTVHGIVTHRGKVGGRPVAYASARSTYFHEADSALGFSALNDPAQTKDAASFQRAASEINFGFNWFYTDSDDIAYYQSGWFPTRAPKTSPDFPIWGTGEYDWRDLDTDLHTSALLPYEKHPQAVNQPFIVSWNNKQAPRWAAADDNYHWGSVFRSQLLTDPIERDLRRGRKVPVERLTQIMAEAGTQDLRGVRLLPVVLRAVGKPRDAKLAEAVRLLDAWRRAGSHRRDLDKDGHYDDDAAVTLMDAWWPRLRSAALRPALGGPLYSTLLEMAPPGEPKERAAHDSPAFSGDVYGQVQKDLRTLFRRRGARKPRGPLSRVYCGGGSRVRCRRALRRSLARALGVTREQLYGEDEECASAGRVEASCSDETRSTSTSGISIPAFPFQNRPTFQQTVELTRRLPR
jgi:acyl-homoserine lactone acylase PvdQ